MCSVCQFWSAREKTVYPAGIDIWQLWQLMVFHVATEDREVSGIAGFT